MARKQIHGDQYEEFQKEDVVSDEVFAEQQFYYDPIIKDFVDLPENTRAVERQIEGKLAEDICKRLNASPYEVVLITEYEQEYWLSDVTSQTDYRMEIRCAGEVKRFEFPSAYQNFEALINWLEEPSTKPV